MRTGYIYNLADPRTGDIRYVGQTSKSPKIRFSQHLSCARKNKGKSQYVIHWINQLSSLGLRPILHVLLRDIPQERLNYEEVETIALYKQLGANLCNLTPGGKASTDQVRKWNKHRKYMKTFDIRNCFILNPGDSPDLTILENFKRGAAQRKQKKK